MAINIDKALGIHTHTLELRAKRAELLANNIANQDTPGYKAKDINFQKVLQQASGMSAASSQPTLMPTKTSATHRSNFISGSNMDSIMYRTSAQPSIDGNTVNADVEKAEYAKNSMRFQASFMFLNSKIKGLLSAIKGQ